MRFSIIRDLIYRIEGYGDDPEYEIESIARFRNGRIVITIREASETEQTQVGMTDGE